MLDRLLKSEQNIIALLNEKNTYDCLAKGKEYILMLKDIENIPIELYFKFAYYCQDFYTKSLSLKKIEDRFYFCGFFARMGEYFCNKYIENKGFVVFNNENDVDFLIEMSMFYELADKYDEQFDLLENIVNNSSNYYFKLKACDRILKIGGLNKDIFDRYKEIKEMLINKL